MDEEIDACKSHEEEQPLPDLRQSYKTTLSTYLVVYPAPSPFRGALLLLCADQRHDSCNDFPTKMLPRGNFLHSDTKIGETPSRHHTSHHIIS
jgi:hypothetical protein